MTEPEAPRSVCDEGAIPIWIKPHTFDRLEALETTVMSLPQGGRMYRDSDNRIDRRGDWVAFIVGDPFFIRFAVIHQGYAQDAFVGFLPPEEANDRG